MNQSIDSLLSAYVSACRRRWSIKVHLQPPATEAQISSCEQFLGRTFPPSYREFLMHTNGCKGYQDPNGMLLGTEDYKSNKRARDNMAALISGLLDSAGVPVPTMFWPTAIAPAPVRLYPENFYPFVDKGIIQGHSVSEEDSNFINSLTQYFKEYRGDDEDIFSGKYTIIGLFAEGYCMLNTDKPGTDLELEVIEVDGVHVKRFENFYAYLQYLGEA